MEVFDVFVKSYESGLPLITLTIPGTTTVSKFKQIFSEKCTHLKMFNLFLSRFRIVLPREVNHLAQWSTA
jgi:hypothetical protein